MRLMTHSSTYPTLCASPIALGFQAHPGVAVIPPVCLLKWLMTSGESRVFLSLLSQRGAWFLCTKNCLVGANQYLRWNLNSGSPEEKTMLSFNGMTLESIPNNASKSWKLSKLSLPMWTWEHKSPGWYPRCDVGIRAFSHQCRAPACLFLRSSGQWVVCGLLVSCIINSINTINNSIYTINY